MSEITRLLEEARLSGRNAAERLMPLVYEELRRLAAVKMAGQPEGHTLQPTALVHEAYLRLAGAGAGRWQNSRHFLAAAADAMRHILIDAARRKARLKRGGAWCRLDLESVTLAADAPPESLLAVNEALTAFSNEDPEKAELVKLRFFAGLTLPEAAEALDISLATAKRHWAFARAWLFRHLNDPD